MPRRKKICAITTVTSTMRAFVVPMMRHLQENGYEATLLCSMDEDFLAEHGEEFRCVSIRMERGVDPIGGPLALWRMYQLFRRERFDIVQYATPNAAVYASIAAWAAGVPNRMYCQWGMRFVGFSGLKRRVFRFLEKIACRMSTHIRPASQKNLDLCVSENLYPREKATVVGPGGTIGVDLTRFDMEKKAQWRREVRDLLSIPDDKVVFGYIGFVRPDKGSNELLAAFRSIYEKDDRYALIAVGDEFSQDPLDPELKSWAESCPGVHFCGRVSNVHQYVAALDVHVHPSYREGFSMALQETAALAVPAISTDIPGPSEVIEKDVTGLLVPARDTESLKEAMLELGGDADLRRKLGEAALERDRKLFARPVMLQLVLEDRNQILGEA